MNIGNYLNLIGDQSSSDFSARRQERLEKRRENLSQTFSELQQSAIERGDSDEAKKLFELSEQVENRLDRKLDRLEAKTGAVNWERQMGNFLDKMRADAYAKGDTATAEKIFGLSQVINGDSSDSQKVLLVQKLLSDSLDTAKVSTTTGTTGSTGTTSSSTGTSGSSSTSAAGSNTATS
ncbi:MAG TPA: hypothetical protein PKY50_18060 [Candidatus Competibacter sp.]|nr:hypothetical protein [Candidatus Competibacter sp.]